MDVTTSVEQGGALSAHEQLLREYALRIARSARDLIRDTSHWTTEVYARNEVGAEIMVDSPDAMRFCSVGARIHEADLLSRADDRTYVVTEYSYHLSGSEVPPTHKYADAGKQYLENKCGDYYRANYYRTEIDVNDKLDNGHEAVVKGYTDIIADLESEIATLNPSTGEVRVETEVKGETSEH